MGTPRCYTTEQLLEVLQIPQRTFYEKKKSGLLPFLEELQPRIGKRARYRAEPIDRYLANKFDTGTAKRRRRLA